MSGEDQVRPYHAKPEVSGQETADAVAAVIKHAQDRDRAATAKSSPKKPSKWMLPVGINLAVFAVYLLIGQPAWVNVSPIEAPSVVKQEQDLRAAMYMQAQRIEGYRIQNDGALPGSIQELGTSPYEGVDYVPQGGSFRLIALVGGETVVYDSAAPDPSFAQSVERAMVGAGG